MNQEKRYTPRIIKACVTTISIILILATAFIFLAFRTDYIFNIDADTRISAANFERTSVTTVIEEIHDIKSGGGILLDMDPLAPLIPTIPGVPDGMPSGMTGNSAGWYEDITAGSPAGKQSGNIGPYQLYNGLPWDADDNTYIYYQYKAKDAIYSMYQNYGLEVAGLSSVVINSPVSGFPTTVDLDGVTCMGICSYPAMMDRNYFTSLCFKQGAGTGDDKSINYKVRIATVLVPKGGDKTDTSTYLYLPCTKMDAKAHTFYGGVAQTNVKVLSENLVEVSHDWKGVKNSPKTQVQVDPSADLGETLRQLDTIERNNSAVGTMFMGMWANNCLETYNLTSDVVSQLSHDYDVVGFVVWRNDF